MPTARIRRRFGSSVGALLYVAICLALAASRAAAAPQKKGPVKAVFEEER